MQKSLRSYRLGERVSQSAGWTSRSRLVPVLCRPIRSATPSTPPRVPGERNNFRVHCSASAPPSSAPGPAAGDKQSSITTGVPRLNIGVFGIIDSGKSSLVNALAHHDDDSTHGTHHHAAEIKTVLLELSDLGPAKLLDTAGLDEEGDLGEKMRRKSLNCLKECDVAVVVVDTDSLSRARSQPDFSPHDHFSRERQVVDQAAQYGVSPLLLLNIKSSSPTPVSEVREMLADMHTALDPARKIPAMAIDLANTPLHERSTRCVDFIEIGAKRSPRWGEPHPTCLPRWSMDHGALLLMVIPMDAEAKGARLLRPQALILDEATRHCATVLTFRLDLDAARGQRGPEARERERQRFGGVVRLLREHKEGPVLLVSDSQAVDVVHPWTLDDNRKPLVPFTTFSICMAYMMSGGRLDLWESGLEALECLRPEDRVLVSEACTRNEILKECEHAGQVEIPKRLNNIVGGFKLNIEHSYGREFPEVDEGDFKVAIHCGGCMIDKEKISQRLSDLAEANVPVTNYGMFFSYAASPDALNRALEPWGMDPPPPPSCCDTFRSSPGAGVSKKGELAGAA